MHRSVSGQATAEYVAVIALVAAILTAAATAVAAPGLPRAIVRQVKLGLCIVGGDICRESDAVARGLAPCVVSANGGSSGRGLSIGLVRFGRRGSDMIERRSDGTLRITRSKTHDLAGTTGLEVSAGPYLKIGVSGLVGVGYAPGDVWEIGAADFKRLVEQAGPGASRDEIFDLLPEPSETFHEVSNHGGLSIGTKVMQGEDDDEGVELLSAGTSEHRELGWRTERDGTKTYYYAIRNPVWTGAIADLAPVPPDAETIVEWRDTDPPEFTMRTAIPHGDGRSEELIGRVALALPELRDAAVRAVVAGAAVGGPALASLATAMRKYGTYERHTYAVDREHSGWDAGVKLGEVLAYDQDRTWLVKRLVDAEVINGPFPAKRLDCLRGRS